MGFATGHDYGFVTITPDRLLYASMNVRWAYSDSDPNAPYFYVVGSIDSPIGFYGKDVHGNTFACNVGVNNPLYKHAVTIKNTLKDGNALQVFKEPGNNQCTYFNMSTFSSMQQ